MHMFHTETQFGSIHTYSHNASLNITHGVTQFVRLEEGTKIGHEHVDDVRFKQDELAATPSGKQKREIQCERNSV